MSPFSRAPPPPLFSGGGKRIRTDDPLLAKQVLYQLSYTPVVQPAFTLSRCLQRLENYIATCWILPWQRRTMRQAGHDPPQQTRETPFTPRDLNLRSVVVYSLERR